MVMTPYGAQSIWALNDIETVDMVMTPYGAQ